MLKSVKMSFGWGLHILNECLNCISQIRSGMSEEVELANEAALQFGVKKGMESSFCSLRLMGKGVTVDFEKN